MTDVTELATEARHPRFVRARQSLAGEWEPQMTKSFANAFRRTALMLTVAAPVSFAASTGFAYTLEAQQMCTGDAFRLCSADIPDIPKITACMVRHRADLSSGCRAVMDRDFAARKSRTVAEK